MYRWLLVSAWLALPVFVAAEPPKFTVTQGFTVTPAPITAPKPVRIVYPSGWHEHECPFDGARWGHTGAKNDIEAHRCPKCGRVIWDKAPGIQLPPPKVKAKSDCPT